MALKERKMTVSLVWANVFCILLFVAAAFVAIVAWTLLWGKESLAFTPCAGVQSPSSGLLKSCVGPILFLVAMTVGIVVHELIHGLTWAFFAKAGWKSISFGVMWKMLTPYCHCSEPLKVKPYIWGALMPLIVLGVAPMLLGLIIRSGWLLAYGAVFVSAAAGDILVAWKLRYEPRDHEVLDHPTEAGCIIYEEE